MDERAKAVQGGCCQIIMSTLYAALVGAYLWNVENFNDKGNANYCRVDTRTSVADYTKCADAGFNVNSTACMKVYTEDESHMIDIHK